MSNSFNSEVMQPLISIITVNFNSGSTLEDAILSVLNQTYAFIEFIIIDGESTDNSKEIIIKHQQSIAYYVSEHDNGIYDAMNKGLKAANGDWVYFLGADDVIFDNDVIANLARQFTDKNAIYFGNAVFKNANRLYDVDVSKWFLCIKNLSHQTLFYPKQVYKNKTYNLKYRLFSDHIYNISLFSEKEYEFIHLPVTVAIYNDANGSSAEGTDPFYFDDLPIILWNNFGKKYAIYVYVRFKIFKLKRKFLKKKK